jgi:signal transduction histidine kinase
MKRFPGRSGRLSGQAIDDGLETVRLTVFVFVLIDLASTVAALSYGRPDFGPSGPLAAAQMVLVAAAAAATMWNRPRTALALAAVVVGLELTVTPSGMELWLLLITGVTIAARAGRLVLALGALAHLGHGAAFGLAVERRDPGSGWEAALLTVAFSAAAFGIGLLARLLLRARDRWWSRVRELERGNAEIRAVERRRLADDLQTAVTRGLTKIVEVVDEARGSSAPDELRRGLSQVDALSRSLLAELRVLLEALRSEGGPDEQGASAARAPVARRWVDLLTARHVRLTVAVVLGLSALRALAGHLTGSSEVPTGLVVVQLMSLTACAVTALRPAAGVPCAVAAVVVSGVVDPTGYWGVLPAALLCLVAGVRFGPRGVWLVVLGLGTYGGLLAVRTPGDPVTHLIVLGYLGGLAWVGGLVVRHLLLARQDSARQAVGLMEERQQVEGQERGALARELHDVVAHQLSLSTMLVMATSWNHDRETLRGTLDQVRRNTEAARSELDTLLRAMRGPRTDLTRPSPLVTATTTADTLAQRLLDNGHTPVMSVDSAADALDATTQRTLARIMQEATTNILRYAPAGSRCHFTLTVEDRWVRLTIASPRSADGHGSELSLGWGLRGIRERVELVRGTFRAGPQDRSWVVAVTLPVLRVDDRPSPRWGSRHGAEGVLSV